MYRPALRMDDCFKDWLDDLFKSTELDRNQILRLAVMIGGQSDQFKEIVEGRLNEGHSLPSPTWAGLESWLWEGNKPKRIEGERSKERGVTNGETDSLSDRQSRGTIEQGNGVLPENDRGPKRETSRRLGEVHTGNGGPTRTIILGEPIRVDGVIRVVFD